MLIKEASEEILLIFSLIHPYLPTTQYNMSLLCVVVIFPIDPIYSVDNIFSMLYAPTFIQSYMLQKTINMPKLAVGHTEFRACSQLTK